jgi:2-methylisocitrate lyase-like PEP mutase family enzyme
MGYRVCQAVSGPVNVLVRPDLAVAEIAEAGARRIGMGGAPAGAVADATITAAERMRDHGGFSALAAATRIRPMLAG